MSDLDIAKAIKHCPYRNTNMRGKCRDGRYDICNLYIEPCLDVVNDGRCNTLIEIHRSKNGKWANNDYGYTWSELE